MEGGEGNPNGREKKESISDSLPSCLNFLFISLVGYHVDPDPDPLDYLNS